MVRFSQYWVDPDDELRQINNFEEEKKQTQILKNQINQSQGFSVANLSSQYGGFMPSGGIIAAGLKELSLQAPEIKTVVDSYLEQQGKLGKRIRDAARGFVRTAFVGADSLAEAVIKRPFQAAAESFEERGLNPILAYAGPLLGYLTDPFTRDEGQESFYQSYKRNKEELGPTVFKRAINELKEGRPVNLGAGYFGNSNTAENLDIFQAIVDSTDDEDVINSARQIINEQLGTPITIEERADVTRELQRDGYIISPGTVAAVNVFEPGTKAFNTMSGAIDIGVTAGLDPLTFVGAGIAKAGNIKKVFKTGESLEGVGLIDKAIRKTVNQPTVDDYFLRGPGKNIAELMAKENNVKNITKMFRKNSDAIPHEFYREIADANTAEEVANLFRREIGTTITERLDPTSALFNGKFSTTLGKAFDGGTGLSPLGFKAVLRKRWEDTPVLKMMGDLPPVNLNVKNLDEAYDQLNQFMDGVGINADIQDDLLRKFTDISAEVKGKGANPNEAIPSYGIVSKVFKFLNDDVFPQVDEVLGDNYVGRAFEKFEADTSKMRDYFHDEMGNPEIFLGAKSDIIVDGKIQIQPTAHIFAEYFGGNIFLPGGRDLARITGNTRNAFWRLIGGRKLTGKDLTLESFAKAQTEDANFVIKNLSKLFYGVDEAGQNITEGALTQLADTYMQALWKPFILLRAAWTTRVVGEEQARMWGADLTSVFSHPISHLAWVIGTPSTGKYVGKVENVLAKIPGVKRRGLEDILGNEFLMDISFKNAMARGKSVSIGGLQPKRDNVFQVIGRNNKKYLDGYVLELSLLHNDVLIRELAQTITNSKSTYATLDDLVNAAYKGDLKPLLDDFVELADETSYVQKARITESTEGVRAYLESLQARLHGLAGGKYEKYFVRPDGTEFIIKTGEAIPSEFQNLVPRFRILQEGDKEIIDLIATGKAEVAGRNVNLTALEKDFKGAYNYVKQTLGSKLKSWDNQNVPFNRPNFVKISKTEIDSSLLSKYDEVVSSVFRIFGSTPTNKLSRSPAFRQFYFDKIEKMAPSLTENALQTVIKQAKKNNLDKNYIKRLESVTSIVDDNLKISQRTADEIAKAFALEETRRLLYQLNKRSQFADATRLMFPFAEVYKEVIGTWGRLVATNPQKLRRAELLVNKAQENGFFTTDPVTGEEVFNFPFSEGLSNEIVDEESGIRANLVGYTTGLNLIGQSVLPGFGPVVQLPASYLPDTSRFQSLKKVIFPLGEPANVGPLQAALPTWYKKVLTLGDDGDPQYRRLFANVSSDILKARVLSGQAKFSTTEERRQAVKSAEKTATLITLIQAGLAFAAPTGGTVRYYKQVPEEFLTDEIQKELSLDIRDFPSGEDGAAMFGFSVFTDVYYGMLRKYKGDSFEATKEFINTFGFEPFALLQRKSKTVKRTPYTAEGSAYMAENKEVYEYAPHTAYYHNPDNPLDEFDVASYWKAFTEGDRVSLTTDQVAAEIMNAKGRFIYEAKRRDLLNDSNYFGVSSTVRRQILKEIEIYLIETLPGFRESLGLPGTINYETQLRELRTWENNSVLSSSDSGQGLAKYLEAYDKVIDWGKRNIRSNITIQSDDLFAQREYLRRYAEDVLLKEHPDFYHLWVNILSRELREDPAEDRQAGF